MANEIHQQFTTAMTLYTIAERDSDGKFYNGSSFETPLTANWAAYPVTMTEQSTTGIYFGTFPVVAAGLYSVLVYRQLGGSPAATDSLVGVARMEWNGTAEVSQTGDAYARLGAAGVGLTNLGDARIAHLDADVSSRSTYAGADTAGTTTLLSRLTTTRAGYLDNLSGGAVALASGVTVTTNNDKTGYSLTVTPPTAAQTATAVWQDATAGDFTTASSIGKSLLNAFTVAGGSVFTVAALANAPTGGSAPTAAAVATAVWQDLLAGSDFGAAGSVGKLLKDDVDAAISSRSTYAGADTAGTATLLGRLTATRAGYLDNLNVGGDVASHADVAALNNITAADVWDVAISGHLASGTTGAALNAAGSSGDPWATMLPGVYGAGTAGSIVGGVGSPMQAGAAVQLAASQPSYAPAVAGDPMTLQDGAITEAKITPPPDGTGQASGVLGMVLWLYRRFFGKSVLDSAAGTLKTFQADGTTVRTTQAVATTNTTQEVDAAT